MNGHTVDNYDAPYPAGWTSSDFFLDPYTYSYLAVRTQKDRDPPVSWEGSYSTDVIAEKAYGLLDEAIEEDEPFFLAICPTAPHADIGSKGHFPWPMSPPIPAERHRHLFPDAKVPRTENFNPDSPSGVSWIKHLERLDDEAVSYNDAFYRARLQALQAVDELVEGVITKLEDAGILGNTYVIYTTDNGYHISQHRLPPGKECSFETDVHIPLLIRGPGVPKGLTTDAVTAHVDLVPTFLKIAGAKQRDDFDGSPLPLNARELKLPAAERQEHVNVEFWGSAIAEGENGFLSDDGKISKFPRNATLCLHLLNSLAYLTANNTYKALRVISEQWDLLYTVWCNNEHELYDMKVTSFLPLVSL